MSDIDPVLLTSATKILKELTTSHTVHGLEDGAWSDDLWTALEQDGWTDIALAEKHGGAGLNWSSIAAFLELCGYYNLPAPIAEHILASRLSSDAGQSPAQGPMSLALSPRCPPLDLKAEGDIWSACGTLEAVPWGRHASAIVAQGMYDGALKLVTIDPSGAELTKSENLAGEPRDSLKLDKCKLTVKPYDQERSNNTLPLYALARAAMMAGAMGRVLELTVEYAGEREQFGRPIAKFQAVQNHLAIMAEEVSAATLAVGAAAAAIDTDKELAMNATAKIINGKAASQICKRAHAVFAAIGFTREHELNLSTRRLWAWRDEAGSEATWSKRLGTIVLNEGGDGLWPWLTD